MNFFGFVFLLSTTLVLIFKKEVENHHEDGDHREDDLSVQDTYKQMWNMLWLCPVKTLILVLMTVKV